MSQVTVKMTTPPVIVECSGALTTTMAVTMALISVGLAAASGQHDVVPPPLIPRDTSRGVVSPVTVPHQLLKSQVPSQA